MAVKVIQARLFVCTCVYFLWKVLSTGAKILVTSPIVIYVTAGIESPKNIEPPKNKEFFCFFAWKFEWQKTVFWKKYLSNSITEVFHVVLISRQKELYVVLKATKFDLESDEVSLFTFTFFKL